jgi:flagellar basal-body rod protein FlgB
MPTAESLDGNTVELHVEQMQFAENVMKYEASLNFLNRKITGLMSAIKGE